MSAPFHPRISKLLILLCLFIAGIALGADSPKPQATSPKPNATASQATVHATSVLGVDVHAVDEGLMIELLTSASSSFKSFQLDNPRRIVVDVINAQLDSKQTRFVVGQANVKSIRLGQFSSVAPRTVRAVFETNGKISYKLEGQPNSIRLIIPFTHEKSLPEKTAEKPMKTENLKPVITASNRPATVVSGLEAKVEGENLVVTIRSDGMLQYRTFELDNPHRLVVDLDKVNLRASIRILTLNDGNLLAARLGQVVTEGSPLVRAVLEATKKTEFKAQSTPQGLKLIFPRERVNEVAVVPAPSGTSAKAAHPTEAEKAPPIREGKSEVAPSTEPPKPVEMASTIPVPEPHILLDRLPVGQTRLARDLKALPPKLKPPSKTSTEAKKKKEVQRAESAHEPARFASIRSADAPSPKDNSAPQAALKKESVPKTEPVRESQPVTVAQSVNPPAPMTPTAAPSQAPVQAKPQSAAAPEGANPSDIISLDLRDVDIRDFFRLIHEVSGLNVILDPNVRGSLTIALKDVPWEQALEIVLKNNQLGKQLEGNVLRIVTLKSLEEEQVARRKILESQQLEEAAALKKTFTRIPSYLKAKDLANVFSELLGIKAGKGTDDVIYDDSTNMVIVRTTPKKMEDLDTILKAMDVKSLQVEIEARVVSANRNFLRDIGVQLGAQLFTNSKDNILSGVPKLNSPVERGSRPPVSSSKPSTTPGTVTSGPLPLNVDLAPKAATSGIGYLFTGGNALIDAFISAAEEKGTAKLLSKPKIITQNHVQGVVEQGIQIPVQTVVNNTVTVQFIRFSLKLTVTPQITEEGTVFLDANVENSTPDFNRVVQGIPTIQTQQAITRVLINDGGTVVIGGVLIDQNSVNIRQVPGLGDVPLIGNLFKNKSVQTTTQELLFFLTPKILK